MKKDPTGIYNKRVTLQFPSGTTIKDGIEETNYVDGATVWAAFDVRPPRGKEIQVGQADHGVSTRWIKIRFIEGINADWRVKYGTTTFKIISPPIDEGMRHRELYLEIEVVE